VDEDGTVKMDGVDSLVVDEAKSDKYKLKLSFDTKNFEGTGMFEDQKDSFAPSDDDKSSVAEIDSEGHPLNTNDDDDATDLHLTPVLPENPVKIGDSWDASTGDKDDEGNPIKVEGKLAGVETIDGKEILSIEYTGTDFGSFGTPDGPLVVKLDPATGIIQSIEANFKDEAGDDAFKSKAHVIEKLKADGK
jgi:hypothetical protein